MRKQQVTMFVSLLLLVVAAAAQTPSQLDRVNVVRGTDDIRVEMSASGTVTPKLSTLDSPARVVVDLPETVMATGQTRIAVGAAGVKGVRIGMDGQAHPDHAHRRRPRPGLRLRVDAGRGGQNGADPARECRGQGRFRETNALVRPADVAVLAASDGRAVRAQGRHARDQAHGQGFGFALRLCVCRAFVSGQEPGDASDVKKDEARGRADGSRSGSGGAVLGQDCGGTASRQRARCRGSEQSQAPTITPAVNLAAEQKAQAGQQPRRRPGRSIRASRSRST